MVVVRYVRLCSCAVLPPLANDGGKACLAVLVGVTASVVSTCRDRQCCMYLACVALVLLVWAQVSDGQLAASTATLTGASRLLTWLWIFCCVRHSVSPNFPTVNAGTTTVSLITAKNESASCLQGCHNGDCGAGTDNYVALAACDERLSQLWLISTVSRYLVNVASGYCLSVTSDDVVVMAGCGNSSPPQMWTLYANDTLEPQSNPGSFLSVCTPGAAGCNAKIMGLFSNDGQLITIANSTSEAAVSGTWEQTSPSKSAVHPSHAQKDKTNHHCQRCLFPLHAITR